MQQPPKKKVLLTPDRVEEIADSLKKSGYKNYEISLETKDKSLKEYAGQRGYADLKNEYRYRRLAEAARKAKIKNK